jgi:NAD(P)-dependent dehydrogenase (short-subunit alcohol dehydrogenase family)
MPATLITGANRGLGLEFSRQYLADEWQVIAACRDPKTALELLALPAPAQKLRLITMDVTDSDSVRAAPEEVRDIAIDVLINNAGVGGGWDQTVGNMDYVEWSKVIDVNTMGPLRILEAFLDHVAASERKLVVTLTSGMGSIADNRSGGSIAYRSSKVAVNMVTRSAAVDLEDRGVTCVVVNPGGSNGYGRSKRSNGTRRKRFALAATVREIRACGIGQVLQSRWSRIRLVSVCGFL